VATGWKRQDESLSLSIVGHNYEKSVDLGDIFELLT
jgi:hypothetical protein